MVLLGPGSVLGGCGNVDPFPGTYTGTETVTLDITMPMLPTSTFTQAVNATFTAGANGMDSATIATKGNMGTPCALTGTDSGAAFLFTAGQACVFTNATSSYTFTLTSGSAALNGISLSVNTTWSVAGSGGLMGTATVTFDGTRM
jgi:hypothetical protein